MNKNISVWSPGISENAKFYYFVAVANLITLDKI